MGSSNRGPDGIINLTAGQHFFHDQIAKSNQIGNDRDSNGRIQSGRNANEDFAHVIEDEEDGEAA